jgi:dephospho-CoA kinase
MEIFKLAVTGSAGSGKSFVCQRLFQLGWPVFDCDRIARQVVEPGQAAYKKMVDLFGNGCVRADGTLDRTRLRNIIIHSEDQRKKMEQILHPAIVRTLFEKIEVAAVNSHIKVAVEVPLLFELDLDKRFDYCVTVAVEREKMIQRIVLRDKVSEKSAEKMLDLQMGLEEKIRRSDYVIWNNSGIETLLESVAVLNDHIEKEVLTIKRG